MNKNDIVRLEITSLTPEGNGVGRADGMVVFVPLTAVGDVIDCKILKVCKSYSYGKIQEIISPSQDRITPDCDVYEKCGGCVFRHISYDAELKAKQGFVRDSFMRIGGFDIEPEPIIGCKDIYRYRNKVQLPVSDNGCGIFKGFFSQRSHRVIPVGDCKIQPQVFTSVCDEIIRYCNERNIEAYAESQNSGLLRHIYLRIGAKSGEIMLTLVVTKMTDAFDDLVHIIKAHYPEIKTILLNINPEKTNVILGSRYICLYGSGRISDVMCSNTVEISPQSFYQVNTPAAETVYRIAKEYAMLNGSETLVDLYCGIGTVGLSMADSVRRLIGVEVVPGAVEDARKNAVSNGYCNAEFIQGDAGKIAAELKRRGERPDVIVVDPPRKGCDTMTLNAICSMSPERVVYISCNHATCARDAKYLCENGYRLEKYRPCDMFPRTGHVETVCLLSKTGVRQHIEAE